MAGPDMHRTAVVSTCGTSLLTNGADPDMRKMVSCYANRKREDAPDEDRAAIEAWAESRRGALRDAGPAEARKLSAELNGLLAWYGDAWHEGRREGTHFLIHSDTWLGRLAAEAIEEWMRGNRLAASLVTFGGLNTASAESFQTAMSDLAKWCGEDLDPGAWHRVIFNLVGGFKSLQGFMQALGMFYADECIYIFESGGELLRIPRLPVRLDLEGAVTEHASAFLRLDVWGQAHADQCAGIPETLLFAVGDVRALSAWGRVAWGSARGAALGQDLLDPLSPRLQFADRLRRDAAALQPDLLARLNTQLAKLARCIEEGGANGAYNPNALDFMQLHNAGGHYECDAFGGNDARRLYGHFEEDVFVVDQLGDHL